MRVAPGRKLYEGKAKVLYETGEPEVLLVEFKDDATAFNGRKKGTITGKGAANCQVSAALFTYLSKLGIRSHFRELAGERLMLVDRLEIIPLEVVVRNVAAGSLAKRLGLQEGQVLEKPVLEFYYKSDALGDPLVNEYHIYAVQMATPLQVTELTRQAMAINEELQPHLRDRGLLLVDFKLEFGLRNGIVVLGDEISADTCRFWDLGTGDKLDKDRFRFDLGRVEEAYQEVLKRVAGEHVAG